MRHQYSCIDFIEVPPANDVAPYSAIVASKPPTPPDGGFELRPDGTTVRIPAWWVLPDDLRDAAKMAGVLAPDDHLARLRTGPVGGARGIFPDELPGYIQSLFTKWRTWEEVDRAKALVKATGSPLPPPAATERVPGWPKWIRKSVAAQLKAEGRDVRALAKLFAKTHHINPSNLDVAVAAQAFEQYLERVRKEAA